MPSLSLMLCPPPGVAPGEAKMPGRNFPMRPAIVNSGRNQSDLMERWQDKWQLSDEPHWEAVMLYETSCPVRNFFRQS